MAFCYFCQPKLPPFYIPEEQKLYKLHQKIWETVPTDPSKRHESHVELIRWKSPPPGFLKLNSDGSSDGNPGLASYGGIIRDGAGNWVCGYMGNIGHKKTLAAELWGIFRGLCVVKTTGLRNVVIETDSMASLLLITVEKVEDTHPEKDLIDECKKMREMCACPIMHAYREGNRCADQIAKLGRRQTEEYVFLEEPPKFLRRFLLDDSVGVGFSRGTR